MNTGLSMDDKISIRKFCGFPTPSSGATGFATWKTFFDKRKALEDKLYNLTPAETLAVRLRLITLTALETPPTEPSPPDLGSLYAPQIYGVKDHAVTFARKRHELCTYLGVSPGPLLTTKDRPHP
jgi:hypothetical protein